MTWRLIYQNWAMMAEHEKGLSQDLKQALQVNGEITKFKTIKELQLAAANAELKLCPMAGISIGQLCGEKKGMGIPNPKTTPMNITRNGKRPSSDDGTKKPPSKKTKTNCNHCKKAGTILELTP